MNGALYVYWGCPGGKDWAEWIAASNPDYYEIGFDESFKASVFLNLGLEYKWSKNTILRVTGYNLLGLLDKDLNKRRIGFDRYLPGRYRLHPVAFGVSLTHKF